MTNKCLTIVLILRVILGVSSQCTLTEVKTLLEGCDRLTGLNVTSVGGTMVNDHNCDVVLPKQVFLEEPLFQYNLADSVIYLFYFIGLFVIRRKLHDANQHFRKKNLNLFFMIMFILEKVLHFNHGGSRCPTTIGRRILSSHGQIKYTRKSIIFIQDYSRST